MKVVQINSVCGSGSTGKICVSISELLTSRGIENYILHSTDGCQYSLGMQYMSSIEVKIQALIAKIFGNYGFGSKTATKKLIRKLDELSPDIVQLHNLHGHNVHLGVLFTYLKERKIRVFWTFHDCWAFTSYCMYFDMVKCNKWINGCEKCPQYQKYSWFFDKSKELYEKKKELFLGLDMTIITPSQWLAELTKKSFLKGYPIKVIHNGIDLNVFLPRKSDFRERNNIKQSKIILLGVANKWEKRKGLDVFSYLAERLDTERFQVVLVGTNDDIDKTLPSSIISIHRTSNQRELAEIYSAADYFINPTREDNFPTVNVEALACGTPVITFDTGGCAECLVKNCGSYIQFGDLNALCEILNQYKEFSYLPEACVKRAQAFNQDLVFEKYLELYCNHEYDK